jgi:hypothetical protein
VGQRTGGGRQHGEHVAARVREVAAHQRVRQQRLRALLPHGVHAQLDSAFPQTDEVALPSPCLELCCFAVVRVSVIYLRVLLKPLRQRASRRRLRGGGGGGGCWQRRHGPRALQHVHLQRVAAVAGHHLEGSWGIDEMRGASQTLEGELTQARNSEIQGVKHERGL